MRKLSKFIVLFLAFALGLTLVACGEKVELSFADSSVTIEVNETKTLTPTVSKEGLVLEWSSSDETIVTVTDGAIKGIAVGEAKVTVSYNKVSAEITVKVIPLPIEVLITNSKQIVKAGDTLQLGANVIPAGANQVVTWSSNNTELATVNETGLVTFLKLGTVIITATSKSDTNISKPASITIVEPDPSTVTVTAQDNKTQIIVLDTLQMTAVVAPDLATDEVTWSVSNPELASIDENGILTAKKAGIVTVTATAVAKDTVKGTYNVTIVLPDPTSLNISAEYNVLQVEEQLQLNAVVDPITADQSVTWTTSNNAVATVDETGKVVAVSAGNAVITATSTIKDTVVGTFDLKVIAKLTNVSYANILVDPTLTAERYSTITVDAVDYIVGVTALTDLGPASTKIVEGTKLVIKAGTYTTPITFNANNVTITGPNKDIDPVKDLEDRRSEANIKNKINIGTSQNVTIEGIKLSGVGQILSTVPVKNITIKNVYSIDSSIDPAQGLIFFGLSSATDINENIQVLNCSINDTLGSGYRGVRINNGNNVTIRDCYFYGFYDTIRLEGNGNSGWTEPGTGSGAAGTIIIENNEFDMNGQYPVVFGRYTATSVEINHNIFGVNPESLGTYGLVYLHNYISDPNRKTVVNVNYNVAPYNTEWHEFRFKLANTTPAQIEINVNYNSFAEDPWYDDETKKFCYHVVNHSYDATKPDQVIINAKNNYFGTTPKAEYFLGADYEPFFSTVEQLEDALKLYVDLSLTGKTAGDQVTLEGVSGTLVYGTNVFSTVADAVAVLKEGQTLFLMPGTYMETPTITVNNVTITSLNGELDPNDTTVTRNLEAISHEDFYVKAGVKNVTIKGISFVYYSQLFIEGKTENITIKNNIFKEDYFGGSGRPAIDVNSMLAWGGKYENMVKDLTIENNLFNNINVKAGNEANLYTVRAIGLMYTEDLVIRNNVMDGFGENYLYGLYGKTIIENNKFLNARYRALTIVNSKGNLDILHNTFTMAGVAGKANRVIHIWYADKWYEGYPADGSEDYYRDNIITNIKFNDITVDDNTPRVFTLDPSVALNDTEYYFKDNYQINLNYNSISGVINSTATMIYADNNHIDAKFNYWGTENPSADKFMYGDVVATNIDFTQHFTTKELLNAAIEALE